MYPHRNDFRLELWVVITGNAASIVLCIAGTALDTAFLLWGGVLLFAFTISLYMVFDQLHRRGSMWSVKVLGRWDSWKLWWSREYYLWKSYREHRELERYKAGRLVNKIARQHRISFFKKL